MKKIQVIDASDRQKAADEMRKISKAHEGDVWFLGRDNNSGYHIIDGSNVDVEITLLMNKCYEFDHVNVYEF